MDGVLIKTGGKVHHDAFGYAFKKVYGINATKDDAGGVEGGIDNGIITNVLSFHGLSQEKIRLKRKAATETMAKYYKAHVKDVPLEVLPGVPELLREFKKKGVPIGLLTGNVEEIAWTKVESIGLKKFFDFGAFGDSVLKRVDLIEQSRKKAQKILNRKVNLDELFIIGDTPRDIKCARDGGIKVIAVATGKYSFEELEKEKPDLLVHTMEEQKPILDFTFS